MTNDEIAAALGEGAGAEYGQDANFVKSPNGSYDFGEIDRDVAAILGRQSGPLRLRRGDETSGLIHIESRHGDQIRKMGFPSVEEFVQTIAHGFTAVYGREGRALDLVLDNGDRGMMIVQLEPHASGDFYDIRTATPIRSGQYKRKAPLWEKTGPRNSPAEAGPLDPKGQSDNLNIGISRRGSNEDDGKLFDQTRRGSIQFPPGGPDGAQTVINLFESADLSTFMHEAGHFFLEVTDALARDPDAPQASCRPARQPSKGSGL
ncbi:hypothetical protein [Paracoccus sp. (in: a-proteobacteria)]|uniref:hypothetical protein n=1 Tax=Paracoccus sp. TaxID=267 RepID=UPI0039E4E74C